MINLISVSFNINFLWGITFVNKAQREYFIFWFFLAFLLKKKIVFFYKSNSKVTSVRPKVCLYEMFNFFMSFTPINFSISYFFEETGGRAKYRCNFICHVLLLSMYKKVFPAHNNKKRIKTIYKYFDSANVYM